MLDGSARWIRWDRLKYFEQNQEIRVYYLQ